MGSSHKWVNAWRGMGRFGSSGGLTTPYLLIAGRPSSQPRNQQTKTGEPTKQPTSLPAGPTETSTDGL
eukprot:CAMPEP_0195068502 /NCGR_PEP_ID=MMETSP0448-20130528/13197_1 /TAXON_ID=66468 /ORGANISM="Heterocapsa triquestra, Strain CCMP 448" /LENGTH=67 /DNA_ID=CAMNT_0040100033 /DNA_START=1 /DNA_END=204 /DNA_ORIENTATION=-